MKITLAHIVEHGSISAAIEALCKESDTVASGVIGSSFSTSGPGSGWQRNYDTSDYADRALADDYGSTSYIDSSDGREAELDEDGDVEWSDESVIELECPSLEDAMDNREAVQIMLDGLSVHAEETDLDAWAEIEDQLEGLETAQKIIAAKTDAGDDAYLWLHDSGDCILWPDEESSVDDDGANAIERWTLTDAERKALRALHDAALADVVDCFA